MPLLQLNYPDILTTCCSRRQTRSSPLGQTEDAQNTAHCMQVLWLMEYLTIYIIHIFIFWFSLLLFYPFCITSSLSFLSCLSSPYSFLSFPCFLTLFSSCCLPLSYSPSFFGSFIFTPCSFPWFPTCLFIRSCSPVLSPDWRYKWILWSLPYWWTISREGAKHQHSRNGFAGIFRMPKQSHLGKHWHYGSKKKRLFLPHPRQWPPSVRKLSRKVWKVFPNISLWLQLGQSVQPDLALPDNGPMNQTLAKNTKIFGIPFIIYEYISCKKVV